MKLKDIAKLANVSVSTVSLVLNNKEGVSKEKRDSIRALLAENGYALQTSDDPASKFTLRFLKFSRHGMLVNGNPGFVNSIFDSIEKECRFQGYNLIMNTVDVEHKDRIIRNLRRESYDALIVLGTEMEDNDIDDFLSMGTPTIVVDAPFFGHDVSSVTMNNASAIENAVKYLRSLGHGQIGFLANETPGGNCLSRYYGFLHAMELSGIPCDRSLIYPVTPSMTEAYESVKALLDKNTRFPSALIANNDVIALGAIRAFREYGIRIPEDISIVGFDDISYAAIADPPLTTIAVPCSEIGIWAVRLVSNYLNYPPAASTKILVDTCLIKRESTDVYRDSTCQFRL